jgi:hypothetical protein
MKLIRMALMVALTSAAIAGVASATADPDHRGDHGGQGSKLVSWTVTIAIDRVSADAPPVFHVGGTDTARIVYDPRRVDPLTGDVRIEGLQHFVGGAWSSPDAQPASDQSVFNVTTRTLDFQRAETHGAPILIVFTPQHYGGVISQVDLHTLIGGPYTFDPAGPTASRPCACSNVSAVTGLGSRR